MQTSKGLEIQKFTINREEELKTLFKNLNKKNPDSHCGKTRCWKNPSIIQTQGKTQKTKNSPHLH